MTLGLSPTEEGCPAGMEMVSCANHCPYSCSDLQEGGVCQEDQACQLGCRCSEGNMLEFFLAPQGSSVGRQVWSRYQRPSAAAPQGFWSRMEAVCQLSTVNAQMPRAAAGPQGAGIKMPATTVPVRLGDSPAPLSPAHLLPTVPGVTGLPGVPAVTPVDLKGNRVALGMSLGGKGLLPWHVLSGRILGASWFHK